MGPAVRRPNPRGNPGGLACGLPQSSAVLPRSPSPSRGRLPLLPLRVDKDRPLDRGNGGALDSDGWFGHGVRNMTANCWSAGRSAWCSIATARSPVVAGLQPRFGGMLPTSAGRRNRNHHAGPVRPLGRRGLPIRAKRDSQTRSVLLPELSSSRPRVWSREGINRPDRGRPSRGHPPRRPGWGSMPVHVSDDR